MIVTTTWHRLEPRVRGTNPAAGLRAGVYDPLWFLGRQWQLGELLGEDAAFPVSVRVATTEHPLTRFQPHGGPAVDYDPALVPLEPRVRAGGGRQPDPARAARRLDPAVLAPRCRRPQWRADSPRDCPPAAGASRGRGPDRREPTAPCRTHRRRRPRCGCRPGPHPRGAAGHRGRRLPRLGRGEQPNLGGRLLGTRTHGAPLRGEWDDDWRRGGSGGRGVRRWSSRLVRPRPRPGPHAQPHHARRHRCERRDPPIADAGDLPRDAGRALLGV